jgi:tetratricopeptide (TPR) repeat protein
MRLALLACIVVAISGCAARQVAAPLPPPVDLAPADALVRAGCYKCLLEAHESYERARTSPNPPPRARDGAFVTAVLLALREKDLDLEATPWLTKARALATPEEAPYLEVASGFPWDGGAPPDFEPPAPLAQTWLERWRDPAGPHLHPELDDYLLLALECRQGTRASFDRTVAAMDLTQPLLMYRAGLCGSAQRPQLERLVRDDPRFAEAWYFIGRYEMATGVNATSPAAARRWLVSAVAPLTEAHDALPDVPTMSSVLAGLMRARTELRKALSLYDQALAVRATHGEALFGRMLTLSYLKRYDEAIAAANTVIMRARGHEPSAYYYLAWSEYQKGQLVDAARDIAVAKRMKAPEEVLVVSGMIAYDQKRPDDARADFMAAVSENRARCVAHWYLGILDLDAESFAPAVPRFGEAATCYMATAATLRAEASDLPPDLPSDVRAEQAAGFEESIAENTRQAGRSFLNAALAAQRAGDNATALRQAREATAFDIVRERAEAIVQRLAR